MFSTDFHFHRHIQYITNLSILFTIICYLFLCFLFIYLFFFFFFFFFFVVFFVFFFFVFLLFFFLFFFVHYNLKWLEQQGIMLDDHVDDVIAQFLLPGDYVAASQ